MKKKNAGAEKTKELAIKAKDGVQEAYVATVDAIVRPCLADSNLLFFFEKQSCGVEKTKEMIIHAKDAVAETFSGSN